MKKIRLLSLSTAALMVLSAWPASAEMESSIARGGRLYDKWFNVFETQNLNPWIDDGMKHILPIKILEK